MKTTLCDWHNAAQLVDVSFTEGAIPTIYLRAISSVDLAHGFCNRVEPICSAIFADEHTLYLFYDLCLWDLTNHSISVSCDESGLISHSRVFKMHVDGASAISVRYTPPVHPFDPTFDGIDEEENDWWLWLSRICKSKESRVGITTLWSEGFHAGRSSNEK